MRHLSFIPAVFLFFVVLTRAALAQLPGAPLPPFTLMPHYTIPLTFNSTTVLVFPAPVKPIDRGDRDFIAQKQPGTENVLKLKAARKNFSVTNLHVFTTDGKIYAFDVVYTDSLATTHDLTALPPHAAASDSLPTILLTGEPVNSEQMTYYIAACRHAASQHGPATRRNQMSMRLDHVSLAGPLLLFRFQLANHSNLDYTLDFVRLYIRDKQKAKRTSIQERDIVPVYQDTAMLVPGRSSITHIIAVPAFTLAGGKQFIVEVYEKNGGRSLALHISNKTLLKARKI